MLWSTECGGKAQVRRVGVVFVQPDIVRVAPLNHSPDAVDPLSIALTESLLCCSCVGLLHWLAEWVILLTRSLTVGVVDGSVLCMELRGVRV